MPTTISQFTNASNTHKVNIANCAHNNLSENIRSFLCPLVLQSFTVRAASLGLHYYLFIQREQGLSDSKLMVKVICTQSKTFSLRPSNTKVIDVACHLRRKDLAWRPLPYFHLKCCGIVRDTKNMARLRIEHYSWNASMKHRTIKDISLRPLYMVQNVSRPQSFVKKSENVGGGQHSNTPKKQNMLAGGNTAIVKIIEGYTGGGESKGSPESRWK